MKTREDDTYRFYLSCDIEEHVQLKVLGRPSARWNRNTRSGKDATTL